MRKYKKTAGISIAFPSVRPYIFVQSTSPTLASTATVTSMIKLIALYRRPADPDEFDRHYFDVHLPLVRKYPGLRALSVTRVTGAPIGEAKFHLMAEMSFDSKDAMDAALASAEGKAVTRDILSFAAEVITVFHGESV
ncbi:MAG TPA: EthD family reductase [Bacteroidota bacterium]|nr:EthD family reductase [Bacteroidota bacterium]